MSDVLAARLEIAVATVARVQGLQLETAPRCLLLGVVVEARALAVGGLHHQLLLGDLRHGLENLLDALGHLLLDRLTYHLGNMLGLQHLLTLSHFLLILSQLPILSLAFSFWHPFRRF